MNTLRPQPAGRACRKAACATLLMVWALLLIAPPGPLRPPIAWADDSRAREIMQKVNDRDDGDNQISELKMALIDRSNKRRSSSWKTLGARASIFVDSIISVSYIS